MNNEKLTSKIKNISRISVVGFLAYLAAAIYKFFPDFKRGFIDGWNDYGKESTGGQSDLMFVLSIPCMLVFIITFIVMLVVSLQLLFSMSRGESPFTEKISRTVKKLGISMIILDIAWALFSYFDESKISIGMLWLAGIVLYAFSLVFRYGTILQKESDETL